MKSDVYKKEVGRMFPVESNVDEKNKEVHYYGADPHKEVEKGKHNVQRIVGMRCLSSSHFLARFYRTSLELYGELNLKNEVPQ